jgi:hypothetical protein
MGFTLLAGLLAESCGSDDGKKRALRDAAGGEGGELSAGGSSQSAGGQTAAGNGNGAASGAGARNVGGAGDAGGSTLGGAGGGTASGVSGAGAANAGAAGDGNGCAKGFAECDGDLTEACEQDLSQPTSCGDCNTSCTNEHGGVICEALACKVTSCDGGYGDCNGDASDGCETALTGNDLHCGACGHDCLAVGTTCALNTCGEIKVLNNLPLLTGGPFNFNAWAFSPLGVAHMTRSSSVVRFLPLDGSPLKPIWDLVAGESGNETLLTDGVEVVWAQRGTPDVVRKKAVTAAPATLPTDVFFPEYLPVYLRTQGTDYYWISGDYGQPGYIYKRARVATQGEPGTRIVDVKQGSSASQSGFAVTTDAIYWVTSDDGDAGTVDNDVRMVPLTGGTPSSVPKVAGAANVTIKDFGNFTISPSLTAVGDAVYFSRTIDVSSINGIYRFRQGDAAPKKIVEAEDVTSFIVTSDYVYYSQLLLNGIWRAPVDGGQGVQLSTGYVTTVLGSDDKFVYAAFINQPSYLFKIYR